MLERFSRSMQQVLLIVIAVVTAFAVVFVGTLLNATPGMALSEPHQIFSGTDLTMPHAMPHGLPMTSLTHQEPNFY
jgi:hypothetical protein